ncbi:MAG TPA: ATP synthase F0 subunit B [Terracidiphilus sp.]|nr:ATP synthase F0 subunit B [Terracidiphilus sp.]
MQDLLIQIGALMVGAAPTAALFVVLVVAYQILIQKPLTETLEKRHALTEGAVEEARKAIELAEERTADYAEKLRLARAEAYKIREQRIRQWNQEREATLELTRSAASGRVSAARSEIDAEAASARATIEGSVAELATQAIRAVLPAAAGGSR